MFSKTGFSLLAAAGVAVGVVGMTMGGATGASTTCVPTDGVSQFASPSNGDAARDASTSTDAAGDAASGAANDATGAAGPAGPQGPGGAAGGTGNGNGTDPLGELPDLPTGPSGPSGASGANGLGGLKIDVHGDTTDATNGSATVTNDGSTVPNTSGSRQALLDLRARSNATNSSTSGVNLSGTHATARSSITGPRPIISLHPGR